MNAIVAELLAGEKRQTGQADMMLEAAGWAASSSLCSTAPGSMPSSMPRAEAGHARCRQARGRPPSRKPAFGVLRRTRRSRTTITTRGLYELYRQRGLLLASASSRTKKIVELPRPAGVIFALTPSTNPVCTRLLQDPAGADDPQRHRHLAAPEGARPARRKPRRSVAAAAEEAGRTRGHRSRWWTSRRCR